MVVSSTSRYTLGSPWEQFENLISLMTIPMWNLGNQSKSHRTLAKVGNSQIGSILFPSDRSTQLQSTVTNLKLATSDFNASLVLQKPRHYLPKVKTGSLCAENHSVVGLSNETTETDRLKLLVGTISNNLDTVKTTTLIIELVEDERYEILLKSLLVQKLDTVSAFAEKLLALAALYKKWNLVKALIESGVDVNRRAPDDLYGHAVTALQYAVDDNNIDMVPHFIERGAIDFSATFQSCSRHTWGTVEGTILELVVDRGHHSLFAHLLHNANIYFGRFPEVTVYHLRNAILLGYIHIARLLLDGYPGLCEAARASPWQFYEAAAACEDQEQSFKLIDLLLMYGFDIAATDAFGHGSILAAASVLPNMPLIEKLLAADPRIDSVAVAYISGSSSVFHSPEIYARILNSFKGRSALHVAIFREHEDLVKLFLSYGADVNQECGLYPIQLAAMGSNSTIVALLIEAGADVHAVRYFDHHPSSLDLLNSRLPPILLALSKKRIQSAEILHDAGATLIDNAKENCLEKWGLPTLMEEGSQGLILSLTKLVLLSEILATYLSDILARRFGANFLDDLADTGVRITETPGIVQVTQMPKIYAIITSEYPGQRWDFLDTKFSDDEFSGDEFDGDEYSSGASDVDHFGNVNKSDELAPLEQRVMDCIEQEDRLTSEHGVRALLMAVHANFERVVLALLRDGFSPFAIIRDTENESVIEVHDRYGFKKGDSAFYRSITYCRKGMVKIFLDWNSGSTSDGHDVFRHQQICKAYMLAICRGHDHGDLFFHHGFDPEVVKQALGQEYISKCLYGALCYIITINLGHNIERFLRYSELFSSLVNLPDHCLGKTPLQLLAELDQIQHVRTLLSLGANVNAEADSLAGATALQFAAINGNFEIVDVLIEAGADVNAPPAAYGGRTAIEGAAEWGRLDMVHYLLEAGADIQLRGNYRRTVYRAWNNGHHTIARMVYRWKKESYGEEDCESIGSVMDSMTRLELDGEVSVVCNMEDDASEPFIHHEVDPLWEYKLLQHERRLLRQKILSEQAHNQEIL
jgi:ankyrin repeat protein